MYGIGIGTLNIYSRTEENGVLTNVWTTSSDHGDVWVYDSVDFISAADFQVIIVHSLSTESYSYSQRLFCSYDHTIDIITAIAHYANCFRRDHLYCGSFFKVNGCICFQIENEEFKFKNRYINFINLRYLD